MTSDKLTRQIVAARLTGKTYDQIAALVCRHGQAAELRRIELGARDWRQGIMQRTKFALSGRTVGANPAELARIGMSRTVPTRALMFAAVR